MLSYFFFLLFAAAFFACVFTFLNLLSGDDFPFL